MRLDDLIGLEKLLNIETSALGRLLRVAARLGLALLAASVSTGAQAGFPPALERYFTSTLKLTAIERIPRMQASRAADTVPE